MNQKTRKSIAAALRQSAEALDVPKVIKGGSRLTLGPGTVDRGITRAMQGHKHRAKNKGDLSSALSSAGYYAKKMNETMYVYVGNSYMNVVHQVSNKPSDYLNRINNTGDEILSVTPDLVVSRHPIRGR